jgi:hypothetical protein
MIGNAQEDNNFVNISPSLTLATYLENAGSTVLRNVGKLLPHYILKSDIIYSHLRDKFKCHEFSFASYRSDIISLFSSADDLKIY